MTHRVKSLTEVKKQQKREGNSSRRDSETETGAYKGREREREKERERVRERERVGSKSVSDETPFAESGFRLAWRTGRRSQWSVRTRARKGAYSRH